MDLELTPDSKKAEEEQKADKNKQKLIQEQNRYSSLVGGHKRLVYILILTHLYLIFGSFKTSITKHITSNDHAVCYHAYFIKNLTYIFLNAILVLLLIDSINQKRNLMQSLHYFDRTKIILIFGMMMSVIIVLFKFIPDFLCKDMVLSFEECLLMSLHILIENYMLYKYFGWMNS